MANKRNAKISENEYMSLREEVIQRIVIMNNQTSTAIVTILTAWVAGISLSAKSISDVENEMSNYITISLVRMLIFIIPVFYLVPLAIKSGENLRQLASLSAYIKVFHDCLLYQRGRLIMGWEISNSMNSTSVIDKGRESRIMKLLNDEYTILAIFSEIFYLIFSCLLARDIRIMLGKCYWYIVIGVSLCIAIIMLFAIIFIHHSSCVKKNLMNFTNIYFEKYIQQAYNLGIFSPKEVDSIRQIINIEGRG